MNTRSDRAPVLLVGSVPLNDAEEVFRVVAQALGDRVAAIPDGETGIRKNWTAWQGPVLDAAPFLERVEGSSRRYFGGQQAALYRYLETGQPARFDPQGVVERLARLTGYVPELIQMGFHFCYGDAAHKHFKEPEDTLLLVETANALAARAVRRLDWLHMPVPRNRSDARYFSPLQRLRLHARTQLYLGLVHLTDGIEGARARIEAARQIAPPFGISTECGMGRRPPETIGPLLALHAQIVEQHLN